MIHVNIIYFGLWSRGILLDHPRLRSRSFQQPILSTPFWTQLARQYPFSDKFRILLFAPLKLGGGLKVPFFSKIIEKKVPLLKKKGRLDHPQFSTCKMEKPVISLKTDTVSHFREKWVPIVSKLKKDRLENRGGLKVYPPDQTAVLCSERQVHETRISVKSNFPFL